MSKDEGLKLIARCLQDGGDELDRYDSKERPVHVTIWNGPEYELRQEYNLNLESVAVLAHSGFSSENSGGWDGDYLEYAIFKFDKGLGVAYNIKWWGPTFGEDMYDLEIQESDDWDKFFNFVLTDDLRSKLSKMEEQLDMDIAEMILLNKHCT